MNEQGTSVLEQYDLEVFRTGRGRGAVLCETNRGWKLLKECGKGTERVALEARCKEALCAAGLRVDCYLKNKAGDYLSEDTLEGGFYTLRDWSSGHECSTRDEKEMAAACESLAKFHKETRRLFFSEEEQRVLGKQPSLLQTLEKHNRELKRARTYIRNTVQKGDFELGVIRSFDPFYEQAVQACEKLKAMKQLPEMSLCHGDFTQHHVLVDQEGTMLVEFSRMTIGVPVTDLYQYLRKMMEKNGWSIRLGDHLLAVYEAILPMTPAERLYLYVLFLYPEKYWKQINHYYNANKAWRPGRNTEKLTALKEQFEVRQIFLRWLERRLS